MSIPLLMVGNFISGSVFTHSAGEALSSRLKQCGWQVITTSTRVGRFSKLFDMVKTAILKHNAYQLAYIEVYSGQAFVWAEIVCFVLAALKKPYVLVLHGGGLPAFLKRHQHRVSRLINSARVVTTPSKWIAQDFKSIRHNIHYLPNAIELKNYPFHLRVSPQPKLVWLRAIHAIYQPWMAVEVLAEVKKKYPAAHLLMIGPDKQDGSLERTKAAIEKHNLGDAVEIAGGVGKDQVPLWLNRGDIFLNTTQYESFGVSVLEAAAAGLAIVTTNAGELAYLWQDRQNAMLVPVDDVKAMAAAVISVLDDPHLAERLSANARKQAETYDWSVVLPAWEQLFHAAVKNGLPVQK